MPDRQPHIEGDIIEGIPLLLRNTARLCANSGTWSVEHAADYLLGLTCTFGGRGTLIRALFFTACCLTSSAFAADLPGIRAAGPICISSADSQILQLKRPALTTKLQEYRDDAQEAALSKAVVFNKSTGFDWAVAALVQCNVALGYLQGGHVDAASSTKCDCFHSRIPVLQ